jgi:integrase
VALTALAIKNAKPGTHGDGDGLYLHVTAAGSKSWILRYQLNGKRRDLGLGGLKKVPAATARKKAQDARELIGREIDPVQHKREQKTAKRIEAAKAKTFKECAESFLNDRRGGWTNQQHANQWESSLTNYAFPTLGSQPVAAIDTALVLSVLRPIWEQKTETALRVRGRIEMVLNWAKANGYRGGENPARWKGHLDQILTSPADLKKITPQPAMPYTDVPAFMADLSNHGTDPAALALRFLILCAARSGEVRGARWEEISTKTRVWTVPGSRMKNGKDHRVPLSDAAWDILTTVGLAKTGLIFGEVTQYALPRHVPAEYVVHGFRSSFRDWAAECTHYPSELAEMALAHVVGKDVERRYRRTDLLAKRRALADDWAGYCAPA